MKQGKTSIIDFNFFLSHLQNTYLISVFVATKKLHICRYKMYVYLYAYIYTPLCAYVCGYIYMIFYTPNDLYTHV